MSSKPRISSRIPSYRLHKPSERAVVTILGKDVYLGKYGTKESRELYHTLIADYLGKKGRGVPPELLPTPSVAKNITVVEAAAKYFEWCKENRTRVEQAHVRGILRIVVELYKNEKAVNIGPAELRKIRREMIAKGWSRKYINQQVDRVKRMFKWLAAEPLIPVTTYQSLLVVEGLRRGAKGVHEKPKVMPVSDEVVESTLLHLPEVVADMVRLQRLTGMRPAELCLLRPCDVDRTGDVWLYRPESHKTQHHGHDRVIFIGPQAQGVLLRYLAREATSYCFQPRDSEAKRRTPRGRGKGTRPLGDRYIATTYRRSIHRACDKAFPHPELSKIKTDELTTTQRAVLEQWKSAHRWSPNRLRHNAGTEIRKQFGLEAAQVVLGHSNADVTQIYAERDLAKGVEVARRIG